MLRELSADSGFQIKGVCLRVQAVTLDKDSSPAQPGGQGRPGHES